MRLARLLFKPKWQEKDATVRRAAVMSAQDPELIEALPRLLREDPDAGVRLAALRRLNDYEHWRERSTADAEKSVRDTARNTYLAMLCAGGSAPSLQRRVAELETLAADEIERVATQAAIRDLRAAALERVTRTTVLVDRAVADTDAQLRLSALDRIADVNLLERIAERARKTDKVVARRARDRIELLRISAGDAGAVAAKASALCERIDELMRRPRAEITTELAAIDAQWNALGAAIPAELIARYRGAHALARKGSDLLQNPPAPAAPPAPVEDAQVATATAVDGPAAEAEPAAVTAEVLASRARFDAALAAAETEARYERERRKLAQHAIEQRLGEFGAAMEAGNSAAAHRLHATIETDLKALPDVPASLQQQLTALQPRYAELKRWQHWSNYQRRRVLCADVEALIGSGLHPDAVATRVRDARDEWQRMNLAEDIGTDAEAAHGMSRRFQALCQQALRPTKVYFSKRKEVRQSHAEEIDALLARAAAISDDSTDWKAIAQLRSEASAALRTLDGVEPQTRTTLAKRLKDVIARLSALGDAHDRDVEAAKRRLIEQATALSQHSDRSGAAREARELQKKWTTLGNGRRNMDQRQWREFRAACDAVFGQLDAARKEQETQATAARVRAEELVREFETLAADETTAANAAKARLRELDARWQEIASDDRALQQRQRRANDAVAMRLKDAVRRTRLARYTNAMHKYTFLRGLESGSGSAQLTWEALAATAAEFDAALAARHARATSGMQADADQDAARDLLVQLEFLAGLESAEEDRQRRMNHQVRRLSARMREGAVLTPENELAALLAAWFAQAPQAAELEQRFERAARAAIDALP